jgi:hypothetical protein
MERVVLTNLPSNGVPDIDTGEMISPEKRLEQLASKGQYTDLRIEPAKRSSEAYRAGELIPDMVAITGIPTK